MTHTLDTFETNRTKGERKFDKDASEKMVARQACVVQASEKLTLRKPHMGRKRRRS